MRYVEIRRNIISIVRSVGVVTLEQLKYFFSDAKDSYYLGHHLNYLIKSRILDYNEENQQISWHLEAITLPPIAEDYIKAFWVIVQFRSNNIRDVVALEKGPTKFVFTTNDNSIYDISIIRETSDALLAQYLRYKCFTAEFPDINENGEARFKDEVNHVAIVNADNIQIGNRLAQYGFDSYCILDESSNPVKPIYTSLS